MTRLLFATAAIACLLSTPALQSAHAQPTRGFVLEPPNAARAALDSTPRPALQTGMPDDMGGQDTSTPLTPDVAAETAALRAAFAGEVRHSIPPGGDDQTWIARAQAALQGGAAGVDHPQVLLVVDRNPAVQQLRLIVANPGGDWQVIGGSRVSTGKPGRREHFKTPQGVFVNSSSVLGYRAEGTYNENHIRGLGLKGMRVWDFGWQDTQNWRSPGATTRIRLEMHATDPTYLEQRMGHPDSEGCVRIPAPVNVFLDRHGIIDADYERAAATDRRFAALLRKDRTPTSLAGTALIVVDSSPGAQPNTPVALADVVAQDAPDAGVATTPTPDTNR